MEFLATAYFTIITFLAAAGFFRAFRNGFASLLWPMLWFLLIFPAPYYITHPSYDYRHAMDPILIILATYACVEWSSRPHSKLSKCHPERSEGPLQFTNLR
jgi:hypothetical protein